MVDAWWFPTLAIIVACCGLVLLTAIVSAISSFVRTLWGQESGQALGGLLIIVFIAYVIIGIGYAVWNAVPHPGDGEDCAGPPYSVC